jgi:signal transduction histidine kinase
MTIRKRLILSYIAMLLIPVVLLVVIVANLAGVFFKEMRSSGELKNETAHLIPSIGVTFNNREQLLAGVKLLTKYEPDRLMDNVFLQETDEAAKLLHAGLVVMKNDRITHASPLVNNAELLDQLEEFRTVQGNGWSNRLNGRFTVEKHDFMFIDRSPGTLYLLSDLSPFIERMRQFLPMLFIFLLLVVGLTNGLLTFLVSRSIIKPLYILKDAAEKIKEGDLDYRLSLARKDEIGEVGEAFEEMRERLKQSLQLQMKYEENRKELISNISHDLKTPITGIKACIEGIRDGIADTEEKKDKYLQMIENKTASMDRLIDELLLFSKLDLKRLPFHYEEIDIAAFVRDYVVELRVEPHMKNVTIHYREENRHPVYVMADREKLQRVLMNIVDNSMKFMNRDDKNIDISLVTEAKEATVRIRDNGAGIESEALPHIFDRFYRAEPSRNTLTGGSGLGLAIVKHIVEELGGRAWAESIMGEGTTISFTLPVDKTVRSGGEKL